MTHVPGGKNATHYVRNTRLGRSITWAVVDPDSCVSMKNDTREHCMHRDTSNACSIKRNVPRECLYAFIREGSMRASCTIPWILTYHLPCGRILGAIICFDRDSSFLGKSWSRLMILDEVGSKKERKKGEKISFSLRLKKKRNLNKEYPFSIIDL